MDDHGSMGWEQQDVSDPPSVGNLRSVLQSVMAVWWDIPHWTRRVKRRDKIWVFP